MSKVSQPVLSVRASSPVKQHELQNMVNPNQTLSIVIVHYNTPDLVLNCLDSIGKNSNLSANVIIVDNKSTHANFESLKNGLRQRNSEIGYNLIKGDINGGFAYGNNIGIDANESEFVLLLNSDTIVGVNALSTLLEEANSKPEFGLFSPRLEWPDTDPQISCFRFHHPVTEFVSAASTGPISRLLTRYSVAIPLDDPNTAPEWTSFACVLIRRAVFEDVGVLDEGFFMYFEDVEFCHRARKAGWKILNVPSAHVVHLRGGTSSVKEDVRLRKRLPRYFYASRTRYYYLLYGRLGMTLANILWTAGRIISKSREFIERRETHIPDKKWRDIWTNWRDPLQGKPPVSKPKKTI